MVPSQKYQITGAMFQFHRYYKSVSIPPLMCEEGPLLPWQTQVHRPILRMFPLNYIIHFCYVSLDSKYDRNISIFVPYLLTDLLSMMPFCSIYVVANCMILYFLITKYNSLFYICIHSSFLKHKGWFHTVLIILNNTEIIKGIQIVFSQNIILETREYIQRSVIVNTI